MSFEIRVTNEPPQQTDVPHDAATRPMLDIFQAYAGLSARPYVHQAEVWERLAANQTAFIVAGTASGKTLAAAVPLFYKLFRAQERSRIRHVLWMYPTIALLEDQRRVLTELGNAMGLDSEANIGALRGGMPRSRLISALNKPIILATPDEIYWFFRKNVKYSSLLIYGLALIDEFVLDEAHLFNGLMLRNFEHLWQRIQTLAGYLAKTPRLHILTATPAEGLQRLSGAQPSVGRSRCGEVTVALRPSGRFDRADQFRNAVAEVLNAGHQKILVVCNAARMAHQLFESCRVVDTATIPTEHRMRFGKIGLGDLLQWLGKSGVEKELIEQLTKQSLGDEDAVLGDIPDNTVLLLTVDEVRLWSGEILERQCWLVKRALWQRIQQPSETWEVLLKNRPLPCRIIAALRGQLEITTDLEKQRSIVDEWLSETTEKLNNVPDEPISCRAGAFSELTGAFVAAGMDKELAALLTRKLVFTIKADPTQLPTRYLSHRTIYLRSLHGRIDREEGDRIREVVRKGLESGALDVECRHIGMWRGTDVPVIVYSGSMAKHAREGLITVFSDLDRAVLVSTLAVEVGVDFHADALITEECEGNSFLQRLGRVGRHEQGSKVIALVSGDTYSALDEYGGAPATREDFSARVSACLPHRNYAPGSPVLDASHYLVNERLGRIGQRLNATPDMTRAKPLAEKLRTTDIYLAFGLRSTMPQITLRDGVTKDPFYLLRYVDDQDLRPSDSPFEIAKARMWFTNLIFQRAKFKVIVDLEETLKASQHLFILNGEKLEIFSRSGIGSYHLSQLLTHAPWSQHQPLYFLLLYGDVYLSRIDLDVGPPEPVRDNEQNPLFIPNQTYLVLWGWTKLGQAEALLASAKVADWEELHYDWDRLGQDLNGQATVILEKTTGACFVAYKELRDHVRRQAQN